MKKHLRTALAVALACLPAATATEARATPLLQLLAPGASLTSDGLVFDQFVYTPTGQMPDASQVVVNPIVDALGNPGIRVSGAFTDVPGDGGSDALLKYHVTSLGAPIIDAHLLGNPLVLGGPGAISVVDTLVEPAFQALSPQMAIFDNALIGGNRETKISDAVTFPGVQSITSVFKDIQGLSQGGNPTLSFVEQTFSVVPEPASLVMFGTGFGGVMLLALCRKQKAATA